MRLLFALLLALPVNAGAQVQDRMRAGRAALDAGDLTAAQARFEEATRLAPGNATAWLLLAQTYAKEKNQAAARSAAQKAEALGSDDPEILQALANFYSSAVPDPAMAAGLGARYAERKPADTGAWQRLAGYCLATGQPDCAIDAANRGLQAANSAALHDLLGSAYVARKQWDRAASEFAAAVKLDPYDESFHFRRAQVYLLQQDWANAVSALENARTYFDKSPQIELALGVARYGQRKFPEAVDQFLRTIRLAPDIQQPYIFLGRILEHAGERLPEITERFAEFQRRNPQQALGYVLRAKAMVAQAPPIFEPEAAHPLLELLRNALALDESNSEAHYLEGIVLERQGKYAESALHLERSVALDGGNAVAHYHLARVYSRLGRRQDSERERALHEKLSTEVNPSDRGRAISPPQPLQSPAPK